MKASKVGLLSRDIKGIAEEVIVMYGKGVEQYEVYYISSDKVQMKGNSITFKIRDNISIILTDKDIVAWNMETDFTEAREVKIKTRLEEDIILLF